MDIREMRYFSEVAKEENITRAAENLHMTQPPLSRALKQLEGELQVELFHRARGKLQLTEAGLFFRQKSQEVLELVEKLEMQMREKYCSGTGVINIGTIETVGATLLPKWVSEFHRQYPEVIFDISSNHTDEIATMVENGIIDVGIIREPFNSEKYEYIRLPEDSWVACIHQSNILARENTKIDLSKLLNEPLILPKRTSHEVQIKNWFKLIGAEPHVVCWYSALMNGVELAKNQMGILLGPKSVKKLLNDTEIVCREIINPKLTSSAVVIWKPYTSSAPAVQQFIKFIRRNLE